jgi:purine-binding chemotaxis protein CheW
MSKQSIKNRIATEATEQGLVAFEAESKTASVDGEELEDTSRQFVTFHVGQEVFGVPIADVQEIVRFPNVTRVPLGPPNLEGLANLRGTTLPIISLRQILGCPQNEHDDATRVLVIDYGQLLGFVVDKVLSVISVDPAQIENTTDIEGIVSTEFLTGVIKNIGGHAVVMALDLKKILESEFAMLDSSRKTARTSNTTTEMDGDDQGADDTDQIHLVSFSVDGQEYAIAIEQVQEIVQVPDEIVRVPNSKSHVLGVITLRNKLLPLVSLRQMFSLKMEELTDRARIVVINFGQRSAGKQCSVGIVTDTVNEVLRIDRKVVDGLPAILASGDSMMEITAIGRLDGGKRLVSFLSAEKMFEHGAIRAAVDSVSNESSRSDLDSVEFEEDDDRDDEEHVVIFRLGAEEFGVPIHTVQEIVRAPETFTVVPNSPHFVEGVVNLRGTVLPVIDQRKRFGMAAIERNDRQRIVVFNAAGTRTGLIVDSVSEVFRIPKEAIEPAPSLSKEQAKLIHQVANLEQQKRMILLLDVPQLLDRSDEKTLAKSAA